VFSIVSGNVDVCVLIGWCAGERSVPARCRLGYEERLARGGWTNAACLSNTNDSLQASGVQTTQPERYRQIHSHIHPHR